MKASSLVGISFLIISSSAVAVDSTPEHLSNPNGLKDTDFVRERCTRIPPPGTCPADARKALIAYDPMPFNLVQGDGDHNDFPVSRKVIPQPPDSDCAIIDRGLRMQGYCVEGIELSHSQSIDDFQVKKPNAKYEYVANISHGMPGAFVRRSRCEAAAQSICYQKLSNGKPEPVDSLKMGQCIEEAKGDPGTKDCPCSADFAELSKKTKTLELKMEEVTKLQAVDLVRQTELSRQGVELLTLQMSASSRYEECKKEKISFYSEEVDMADYGKILKAGGTLFSVSCDTGAEPKKAQALKMHFCKDAPEGTSFNLALNPTRGGMCVNPSADSKSRFLGLISSCVQGKCNQAAVAEGIGKLVGRPSDDFSIWAPIQGTFACFRCEGKNPVPIDSCNGYPFPYGVKNLNEYKGEQPEARPPGVYRHKPKSGADSAK